MQVEMIMISDIKTDRKNARKHSKKNLAAIRGSLAKFGQQKPIVIDDKNTIIAGNGTVEAAKALGWTAVGCVRSDLVGTDRTAFAIADNRTSELATWDDDILPDSLTALYEVGFDLSSIGFDAEDLKQWLGEPDSKIIEGSKELDPNDFDDFTNKCPRCGFEFDGKDPTKNGTMESD